MAAQLPPASSIFFAASALDWRPVTAASLGAPASVTEALKGVRYSVIQVRPTVGDSNQVFESIQVYPGEASGGPGGRLPTIICPHGGPHTALPVGWFMPYAFLASLGFAVILPNYR